MKNRDFAADVAVVIGVADYDPAVGRLETPVHDARKIAALLRCRFRYRTLLRYDDTASLDGLRTLLSDLPNRVLADSRFLFYFAGHGVAVDNTEIDGPDGYLVPHGATSEVRSHLPMRQLYEVLESLPCRHLLVILDCCFSGSFRWARKRPMHIPGELLYEERYRHWVKQPARWILTSTAHDEFALDTPNSRRGQQAGHSPFAAAILDGLGGQADTHPAEGDGIITMAELYAYVRNRLAPHQSPMLAPVAGQTRGEFIFRDPSRPLQLRSAEVEVQLDPAANPYRGLKPYETGHAGLFFGRSEATQLLREHVENHSRSLVVGSSGSGKSSLVQAGLLHQLRQEEDPTWTAPAPFRVLGNPFAPLRETLIAATGSAPGPEKDPMDPDQAEAWATTWASTHPSKRLLLVVDQAEELVTHLPRSDTEGEQQILSKQALRFLECLNALVRSGDGQVRILMVVRSDYEADLDDGQRSTLWKAGRFVVPPLRREDLREIVEGPAQSKALYFEDRTLVDRLVDEVWNMPGGLPLLSYALSQLFLSYVRQGRGDRVLTADDLEAIGSEGENPDEEVVAPGGIVRVLRTGADQAVADLPGESHRQILWRVFLRMVNVDGARTTRRPVPRSELVYPLAIENQQVEAVCTYLIDKARLLVSDKDGDRELIEPAHDQLLVAWPALAQRIDEYRLHLPIHRRLTETATAWAARPKPPRYGLDLRLVSLFEESSLPREWLNRVEREYLSTGRTERLRRSTVRRLAIAAILVLSVGAIFFRYVSIQEKERAILQQTESLARGAESANRQQDFAAGGLLALESLKLGQTDAALASLALSKSWSWPLVSVLKGHTGPLSDVSFSPDGNWLVSTSYFEDNTARLWNAKSFQPGPPLSHPERIYRAVFHPNRPRVAVTDYANKVHLWDFDTDKANVACTFVHNSVRSSLFEAHGKYLVTYSHETAKVWSLSPCEGKNILDEPLATAPHDSGDFELPSLPSAFVTLSDSGVSIYGIEADTISLDRRLDHPGVSSVDVAAGARRVITSGEHGVARIWDLSGTSPTVRRELVHDERITSGRISRDGHLVVTGSEDGTAKLWEEVGETYQFKSLLAHGAVVKSALLDPAGRWVATSIYPREDAGPDSLEQDILWIWDVARGVRTAALLSDVTAADFSPDGTMVAVAGFDKTIRIWRTQPDRMEIPRDGFISDDVEKTALGFDRQGRPILVDRFEEQARVWDLAEGDERFPPLKLNDQLLPSLFLSNDGERVVAIDHEKVVQWNSETGAPIAPPFELGRSFQRMPARTGSLLVLGQGLDGEEGLRLWNPRTEESLRLWDPTTGEVHTLESDIDELRDSLTSENGVYAAIVGDEQPEDRRDRGRGSQVTELWNLGRGELLGRFERRVQLEAVHPEGHSIVGLREPSSQFVVLMVDRNQSRTLRQDGWVTSARFNPDGSRLATASRSGTVQIWDTQDWQLLETLPHRSWVTYATYDPQGVVLASTATDGTTRIWDASSHEVITVLHHHQPQRICFFSPDSAVLVSQSKDKSTVWNWRDEIVDAEEDRLALRFSTASQLSGSSSQQEAWLRLPAQLPRAESRAVVQDAARKLLAGSPKRSAIHSAARAVLDDSDPSLAWIDLYHQLSGHPRSNGYRLLVLEELERLGSSSSTTENVTLALLLAATRAEGAEDTADDEGVAEALRESVRARAQSLRDRGEEHPVVEAIASAERSAQDL